MNDIKEENTSLQWFIRRGKTLKGPFTSAKIRHHIIEERLRLTDEVSQDKLNWKTIADVPEVIPLSMRQGDEEDTRLRVALKNKDKRTAWLTIIVLIILVTGLIFFVAEPPAENPKPDIDCTMPALQNVNWRGCRMRNRQLPKVNLSGSDLGNIKMVNVNLSNSILKNVDLKYGNLSTANLTASNLSGSDLTGSNLAGSNLTNVNFTGVDLSHADLSGALLEGAIFKETKLSGTIWPNGERCAIGSVDQCKK